ncbi:MAG TPA: S41 family peptidase [Methylomirabilota bacterium]|jgi:carboxyl-terminal processing protease|nr:S41 family peptidase [Methylomirabilota bacterium]
MRAGKPVGKAILTAAVLAVLTLSLGGTSASKGVDRSATYEQLKLFTDVLTIIQNQYVDETEPREVIYGAVRGMLRALDPHSSFMDPESYREMQVETSGSFGGLGIEITIRDDQLTVVAPIEGTPAWRAGIQPGDRIVKIEGLATKDMNLPDAVKRMRGPKGTKVTISIVREGTREPFDVALVREVIQVQSIRSQEIEPGIGYIRVRQFQERTAPDLVASVEKFDKAGKLAGLIVDVRNNPGGLLSAAVEVSEEFLGDGKLIVYTEGRVRNQNMRFTAHARRAITEVPMVVLVNQGSASASEIVAGAIQDHGRGVVIGQQTFGKGSVQTIIPLADGSGLRLTTARYFTPKGRSIHGKGITPDIVIDPPKDEVTATKPGTPPLSEAELMKRDVQLQRAIEILKASRILDKTKPTAKAG